eukprot:COSAG01_NODE_6768_length_3507_cov_3.759977_3_plen_185_part_00
MPAAWLIVPIHRLICRGRAGGGGAAAPASRSASAALSVVARSTGFTTCERCERCCRFWRGCCAHSRYRLRAVSRSISRKRNRGGAHTTPRRHTRADGLLLLGPGAVLSHDAARAARHGELCLIIKPRAPPTIQQQPRARHRPFLSSSIFAWLLPICQLPTLLHYYVTVSPAHMRRIGTHSISMQ